MASLVAIQPVAVKCLAGSSISGRKLAVRPSSRALCRTTRKPRAAVVAKYGEKGVYFDLDDISNTTGQWDLYGSDAPSPYNPLQSKFFETFAAPFTKRGLLLKFLLLGGGILVRLGFILSGTRELQVQMRPLETWTLAARSRARRTPYLALGTTRGHLRRGRMTRSRIPPERVRGEHVLLLGRLLHHLRAPFPEFFQDVSILDGSTIVGVAVTGIPLNPAYCVEFTSVWRSPDDYVPLQEVARKAIFALRAHFSDQLSDSQFGEIPSIAPGSFGLQFGPSHPPSYPPPPLAPATLALQRDTTGTMLLAGTLLYDSTRGALARAEESSDFWRQQYYISEAIRGCHHSPTPDAPPYHPTYPPSDPGPSSYTAPPTAPPTVPPSVPPPDPPLYSAVPPYPTYYSFLADDLVIPPPVVSIPEPSHDLYPAIHSPPFVYPHIPTSLPQGDLGGTSAPPLDSSLPHRPRPEFRGPRITVHPDPVRETTSLHEIFYAHFGDPSSSGPATGIGTSSRQGAEGEEEEEEEREE